LQKREASTVIERNWNQFLASSILVLHCRQQKLPFHSVTKRCTVAIKIVSGINNLEKLSVNSTLKLFKLRVM
jgi:hypothetical protein